MLTCRAFSLDEDEGLLQYLDSMFVPQEEFVFDAKNNRKSLIGRAKEAMSKIKGESQVRQIIQEIYYR